MRSITQRLIDAMMLDLIPDFTVCIDFGIPYDDPTECFGALQWAYKQELVTAEELDSALGSGEKLTEIVYRESPDYGPNPYRTIFVTAYDDMPDEDDEPSELTEWQDYDPDC